MTEKEIYEMVRQSDLGFLLGDNWMMHHEFVAFANLVAAKERRECAKLAAEVGYWGLVHEIEARGEQA